jgi:hypothetical protein
LNTLPGLPTSLQLTNCLGSITAHSLLTILPKSLDIDLSIWTKLYGFGETGGYRCLFSVRESPYAARANTLIGIERLGTGTDAGWFWNVLDAPTTRTVASMQRQSSSKAIRKRNGEAASYLLPSYLYEFKFFSAYRKHVTGSTEVAE